jgi:hydrogenase 3 maturation protease
MNAVILNEECLKNVNLDKKICLLGIGNFDRADDYAGIAVVEALEKNNPFNDNINIINAGAVPEAFTGVIKEMKPDWLIIIDTANLGEVPGKIKIFCEEEINETILATPHNTPITMFTKYLRHFLPNLEILFIGIQPTTVRYGEQMTAIVEQSIENLSQYLTNFFSQS